MSAFLHFGIALYFVSGNSNTPAYFHWGIAATESASLNWNEQPITILELARDKNTGPYFVSMKAFDVMKSSKFTGIIHLFSVATSQLSLAQLKAHIAANHPASDSGWRLPGSYGPQGWTCATWALRIMVDFKERGFWTTSTPVTNMYVGVLNAGHRVLSKKRELVKKGSWTYVIVDSLAT